MIQILCIKELDGESPWHNCLSAGLWFLSEFELQSLYYIHFWMNTLRKGMNLLIFPTMS